MRIRRLFFILPLLLSSITLSSCKQVVYVTVEKEVEDTTSTTNTTQNTTQNSQTTTVKTDDSKTTTVVISEHSKLLPAFDEKFELTESKKVNIYYTSPNTPAYSTNICFPKINNKEVSDIPYISIQESIALLGMFFYDNSNSYQKISNTKYSFTNVNTTSTMTIDANKKTISFDNYLKFCGLYTYSVSGSSNLLKRTNVYTRNGKPITFDLDSYGIPVKVQDDQIYIPLQVFNSIFMTRLRMDLIYNGKDLYFSDGVKSLQNIKTKYYETGSGATQRSTALINLSYNVLCFYLDAFYGLKEKHNIDSLCVNIDVA